MLRSSPRLLALLLTASALSGCAAMSGLSDKPKEVAAREKPLAPKAVAGDIDGNLRQAQLLRQAGTYDEAIHILSQLTLVAADDPRVVAEYGKTLAQKGRASDATQFLRRAIELSPNDWTLYSALGVSYDQLGDAANARLAYEHALNLKPGDAGVLNNYALSRMLAKDPDGAHALIARAQAAAGPVPDTKITRNLALINEMAPLKAEAAKPSAVAAARAVARPEPKVAIAAPVAAPVINKPAAQPAPASDGAPRNAGDVARLLASQSPAPSAATGAPRPLAPQMAAAQPQQFEAQPITQAPAAVVMQAVPYDPYAGPVVTLKKPAPKPKAVARAEAPKAEAAKDDAPKPERTAAAAKPGVVPALRIAADKY